MKTIKKNKQAVFDNEILEEFTAGLMLTGSEVKSIRAGNINLKGAYISQIGSGFVLKNAHISKYPFDRSSEYDPFRNRPLLLNQREIGKITSKLNQQGVTVIPLEIGTVGDFIKLNIAVARGRKKHDKRHLLKERDQKKTIDRLIKSYR